MTCVFMKKCVSYIIETMTLKDVAKAKKRLQNMQKAQADLNQCQQRECLTHFVYAEGKRKETQSFMYKLTLQVLTKSITLEQFKERVHAYIDKNAKDANTAKIIKCSIDNCRRELNASLKVIGESANNKFDQRVVKSVEDHIKFVLDSTHKMVDITVKQLESAMNKK